MTVELWMLVWAVVLTFVQMLIAVSGATLQIGLVPLVGNRENLPPVTGWAGRASRAYRNMLEYLLLFAALVLVEHIANSAGSLSALGAQIFFYARVVYAAVYLVGIPWLRTGIWSVSVVGLVMIAIAIFQTPAPA